jgi:hypothetical protein
MPITKSQLKQNSITYLLSSNNRLFQDYFPLIITLVYALCTIIGMYYHLLWRDELEIYTNILHNGIFKYNGPQGCLEFNSILYYGLLHIILNYAPYFIVYQAYHFIIATLAVYIFNKYSNFNKIQIFLFTFSYFMVFEYGIIGRWYGFFILLLFYIIYLLTRERKNYFIISILLIILANHNISSAIFSCSLTLYTVIHILNGFIEKRFSPKEKSQIKFSFIVLGVGFILLLSQYVYVYSNQRSQFESLGYAPFFMTIRAIWNSFIPIPDFSNSAAFWNTNVFPFPLFYPKVYNAYTLLTYGNVFTIITSILIILICLIIFSKKLPVLITFLFNTGIYIIFLHFFFKAYFIRHQGLLFIIFVYCCWLFKYSDDEIKAPFFNKIKPTKFLNQKFVNTVFLYFVTIIFFFQFIAGVLTYPRGIMYQFTKSWDAANYIKNNNYKDYVIVGAVDYAVVPIAVILDREIFLPQTNKFSKTMEWWGVNRNPGVDFRQLLESSIRFLLLYNKKVLIILNFELKNANGISVNATKLSDNIFLKKLMSFEGDIIQPDEQYYLYELIRM